MTSTTQKMRLSMKNFSSKCDQIRSFLRIWSHLLEKSFTENFIFCAVKYPESSDFLDKSNSSSSDTESDEKSTAGTFTAQIPTLNSKNNSRWRKKQARSFDTSFKVEFFLLHHRILYHLINILKSFLMAMLLNILQNKQIYTQFKLALNQ